MFGWLKRLFNIGKAEAHSVMDKLENPIKMTEQGIRDLKKDLNQSMQSLAQIKASRVRTSREYESAAKEVVSYEQKAILLLQKAESGELAPEQADDLATKALEKKKQAQDRRDASKKNLDYLDQSLPSMQKNVTKLKQEISKWENELTTLKARARVSQANVKLNKQLAGVDSSNTLSNLEKMKEKVQQQEALAASYEDINQMSTSVDDEIDKALGSSKQDDLQQLKAKMQGSTTELPKSEGSLSELDKLKQKLKN